MLLILLLFATSSFAFRHQCSHQIRRPMMNNPSKTKAIRLKVASVPQPIRIHMHYEDSFNRMLDKEFIKHTIISPAVKFWEKTILVKHPMTKPILLNRLCVGDSYEMDYSDNDEIRVCRRGCRNISTDADYYTKCYTYGEDDAIVETGNKGNGLTNADLVILVDSGKDCSNTTLASAIEERIEDRYNRPIIGSLSICPNTIDMRSNIKETIQTVKHEILHLLGFSVSLYAYFRDEHGNPRTPRDASGLPALGVFVGKDIGAYKPSDTTMKIFNVTEITPVGSREREKAMLVTPNLVREARQYYNCSTLKGVLLEDYGEKGNAWSHFEMKTAYNELMSSVSNEESYVSRLSLALLEDSGWYYVDYKQAEDFTYGKDLGCDFVNKNCFEYIHSQLSKNQSAVPWCSDVDESICSKDRNSEYTCSYQYGDNTLAPEYKYFKDKKIYSIDPYVDYCPMYMAHYRNSESNIKCSVTVNSGKVESQYNVQQSYGPLSICITTKYNTKITEESCGLTTMKYINGGACHTYRCSRLFGLMIKVNGKEYQCVKDREIVNFSTRVGRNVISGSFQCPICADMCDKSLCVRVVKLIRKRLINNPTTSDKSNNFCSGVSQNNLLFAMLFPLVSVVIQHMKLLD